MPIRTVACVALFTLCLLATPPETVAQTSEDDARGFVASIAATAYAAAWPTAKFEGWSISSISQAVGGMDVLVRLRGESGLSGGDLWVDLRFVLRGGGLEDVQVERHNAALFPPFSTAQALAELAANAAAEYAVSSTPTEQMATPSSSAEVGAFRVTNNCAKDDAAWIAVRWQDPSGRWQDDGWWKVDYGQTTFLTVADRRITSTNRFWYFYAENEATSWQGDDATAAVEGRTLPMRQQDTPSGDYTLNLTCTN